MIVAEIVLIILTSATASLGNTLLKIGASRAGGEEELLEARHVPRALLHPAILCGVFVYGVSQLMWITVLRLVDLSLAYPLQIGLNFCLIMLVAWSYFKEPLSTGKLFGVALIFGGMLMIALG